ncbi:LacI family DNA-binding transcriptional regulator [Paremcibacter congregatus]|uniref:LacI family transcriptional regulator n=1 Tax=Paremcibacter congregatus TaxID=2043170 RepID=A0A2G4YW07_9PROT|nr:LacI family DNA-binding transcriptional regulator [Paremcibacter congregatus]PHZ86517.1 LacI family transcriptional regulator [Paremcibacter congregatus]QDE26320.1 LacI family transcriptional regulator [Paremcibacter congregatus]
MMKKTGFGNLSEGYPKVTTVYDVANAAKVSIATVSRVFNNRSNVSEATRLRVRQAAEDLNYSPHMGARSLMNKRTDTIGIVLPDMHGEFFSELMRGADMAARKLGQHLLISCSHDNSEEMAVALSAMRGKVDGIVVMSPLLKVDTFRKYLPNDLPIVIMNGNREITEYPTVTIDNYDGAIRMTRHLLEEGHKKITLISGPSHNLDAEQRRLGYCEAITISGLEGQPDIIEGDFSEESGYQAGMEILSRKKKPDAVFASNDAMAIGCLCAFQEHGILIPNDIALAGFDDIPLARYMKPSLTTVKVPIAELGSKSIEMLLEKLHQKQGGDHGREFVFLSSLIIRDSSRRIITG